jgi:hypothetical protein
MKAKKCRVCKKAAWVCRVCGRLTCEHYCSLKTGDGTAVCGKCKR